MKNILITNLGTQDLQVKSDKLENIKSLFSYDGDMLKILGSVKLVEKNLSVNPKEFRKFTKKLLDTYPKWSEFIDFPIIKSVVKKVEGELGDQELQKIILIVTDQNDVDHNEKDTVYLGEIIKKLSCDKKLEIGLNKSKEVLEIVEWCTKSNPSDYDEMTRFYDKELRKEYDSKKIFLNITGGTPAMSFGLLYNTSINANCRVVPFYTKQTTNTSVKLNICETLRKDDDKKQICEFITKNDYMAAKILLEKYNKYGVSEKKYETALNMIKAAHARIQFDFKNASVYIEKAEDYDSGSRSVCDKFIYFLKELQNNEKIYLLNELKNNAIYEYENGAYTDFLGRVFRMEEAIYRYILIEKNILEEYMKNGNIKVKFTEDELDNIKQKTDSENTKNKLKIDVKQVSNNLKKILKDKNSEVKFAKEEIEYIIQKTNSVYTKRAPKIDIEYMSNKLKEILHKGSKEEGLYIQCSKMDKLKQIRNNSVLAHGYKGVSKDEIDGEIGNAIEFLDSLILQYKKIYNIEINDDNFYDKNGEFNSHLIELIEEI